MLTINMNTGEGYKELILPDKQPHITLDAGDMDMAVKVICSLSGHPSLKLIELCMVAEILNRQKFYWELHIPYLMGARWDRIMPTKYDSFDLKVVANIINSLKANVVYLYDPHSDVAPALIENVTVVDNRHLVEAYKEQEAVLIIPDAGAAKKAFKYAEWNPNIKDFIHCIKHRDPSNGNITLEVLEPEKSAGRNCVIIDDICDGGGTFIQIANQLGDLPASLTLIVTHGIFSKGFHDLENLFDQIITSDSHQSSYEGKNVKVIPYDY